MTSNLSKTDNIILLMYVYIQLASVGAQELTLITIYSDNPWHVHFPHMCIQMLRM